jgi:hypothetical protein
MLADTNQWGANESSLETPGVYYRACHVIDVSLVYSAIGD